MQNKVSHLVATHSRICCMRMTTLELFGQTLLLLPAPLKDGIKIGRLKQQQCIERRE